MPSYQDIRQMWEDLGMDMEAHDGYVAAFPRPFKEIILSQKGRPQAMGYFDDVVKRLHGARPWELYQHKQAGGKVVGTYCVYVPDEVIYALGAVSTGLCGGDQFWVPGGEKVLPANTCALIKSSLGSRLDRTSPFCQVADLFVGENTCDGKKKAWEILGRDVDMHVMDVPQMKREKDVTAFAGEIMDLARRLEEMTGQKLSADKLRQGMALINGRRAALQRLQKTREARPAPISGKDALMVVQVGFYDDPARFAQKVNLLCDELEARVAAGQGVFPSDAPRVMITGSPMAAPNWKLHHMIESAGAVVVAEEICTGTRFFENLVDDSAQDVEGLVMALSQRYMKNNCACFTPNPGRLEDILRLAGEHQVDGVIEYCLQFCALYATESHLVAEALKGQGLPFMHLETDYTSQDSGQLVTRVESFVEMLSR